MRRARLVISMVLPCQISLSHAARPDVRGVQTEKGNEERKRRRNESNATAPIRSR